MSIDPITGKIVQTRVYNKINYQTSFTDFKIFHLYCKAFKREGAIEEKKVNSLLGQARKSTNLWQGDTDSHARVTLLQYKLIEEDAGGCYKLSKLGENFLSLFNDDGEIIAQTKQVHDVLFDMLASWHQIEDEFDIHPGLIILRLLLQPELHYYLSDHDVACIFNNTTNTLDSQYMDFVRQILEFRDSGIIYTKSELKKTYTLLTGYANNWGIFELENRSNGQIKYVHLNEDFKEVVVEKLGLITDEKIMTDDEFSELITEEQEIADKIAHYEQQYGELGTIVNLHKSRASEIQQMFRNRLIKKYGQKCLLCDITNNEMLVASHIKPYVKCDIGEKIDNENGFMLCANHDKLFDRCLISFNARSGKIMISSHLTDAEKRICNLNPKYTLCPEILTAARRRYLIWHNSEFENKEHKD